MYQNMAQAYRPFDAHPVTDGQFFEGWYFKIATGSLTAFCIPGIYRSPQPDASHAFVMFWYSGMTECAYYRYPTALFAFSDGVITVGPSKLSRKEISLNLSNQDLWDADQAEIAEYLARTGRDWNPLPRSAQFGNYSVQLEFENVQEFPSTMLSSGCMGIAGLAPFLQCYHGIGSMHHDVKGKITAAGDQSIVLTGTGYIEKDWGRSFPETYLWIQSHSFKSQATLLCSVASVPLLGAKRRMHLIIFKTGGKTYNFSTYTLGKVSKLELAKGKAKSLELEAARGKMHLILVARWHETAHAPVLRAPLDGYMKMHVQERNHVDLHVKLVDNGKTVFDEHGQMAGLEMEGDMDWLFAKV